MQREDILEGVRECLVSVLGVEKDDVTLDTSFVELNMESIDVLDVMFGIEKRFDITTSMSELRTRLLGDLTEEEFFDEDRVVTAAGLRQLQKVLPDFEAAKFDHEIDEETLFSLFRVRHLVEQVEAQLQQRSQEG